MVTVKTSAAAEMQRANDSSAREKERRFMNEWMGKDDAAGFGLRRMPLTPGKIGA
jgi:hypothetical protein